MEQQIARGWWREAEACPSPNCNARPGPEDISLLVLHNISLPPGEFGGEHVRALFCNQLDCSAHPWFEQLQDLRVSAHLLIDRHGKTTQFVPFTRCAWHAGVSNFRGRDNCNDFSIGIELEGTDDQSYTASQYDSLARVSKAIMHAYPTITRERIVGHSDIAPGRKTDPGPAFDWKQYWSLLDREGRVS